ncbi:MAG TPA: NlpC/P60 family protein [Terracidiphilus sp.]|nr:NlpC/P60 family protein [Terracidiphilus sp.]
MTMARDKQRGTRQAAKIVPRIRLVGVRRLLASLHVTAALLLTSAAASAQMSVPGADLVVARPVVNMYRNPTTSSDVVSQAIYGTDVLSFQKQPGWYDIHTADGYAGWVQASDVLALDSTPYAPKGEAVRVTGLSANVYREPDVTRHAALLRLPWEARLETLTAAPPDSATAGRWLEVRLVDGQTAWVQNGDVSANSAPLSIDETLLLARRFLGITYTWGGVSSFGFDCSGFTQMLVRQRGIEMPRDADLQAAWTGVVPVKREDLEPGDLLYFGSSPTKITHTGMYIGDGQFIHDTTHGHPGVQISKLDDMPWTKLLVAARRVQ